MKIRILAAGKLRQSPLLQSLQDYLKRCAWTVEIQEIDQKNQKAETEKFISCLSSKDYIILLDETGRSISSHEFAEHIEGLQNNQISNLTFVIGGAFGIDPKIKTMANLMISFGRQTWPHLMVRLMLVEQLYRAEQILKGHPYHKD